MFRRFVIPSLIAVALVLTVSAIAAAGSFATTVPSCAKWAAANGSDSNSGTQASPFRHITALAAALGPGQTGCLKSGDVFDEAPDSQGGGDIYHSQGTAQAPITIASSDPANPAQIIGQINVIAPNIDFDWVHFAGSSSSMKSFMVRVWTDNVGFHHDEFNWTLGHCLHVGEQGTQITGFELTYSRIHDCGNSQAVRDSFIHPAPRDAGVHGLYMSYAINPVVENNFIYDNLNRGIQLYDDVDGAHIDHNVIDGNGSGLTIAGEDQGLGPYSENNLIDYNIISNSTLRTNDPADYPYWPYGDDAQVRSSGMGGLPRGNLVQNNCISPEASAFDSSNGFSQSDNTFQDPQYVDRANHNYALQAGSPCAGKGPQPEPTVTAQCGEDDVTVDGATSGNDTINGTSGDDVINGLGGNDTINGAGGNDTICGGDGSDRLTGGVGNDTVYGNNLGSFPSADAGDVGVGDPGDDTMFVPKIDYSGAPGPVKINLDSSTVTPIGGGTGTGTDHVYPATRAIGSPYADQLLGPPVPGTVLQGGGGNDSISSQDGGQLSGGPGNDRMAGAGGETYSGGAGTDTVNYASAGSRVTVTIDGLANDGRSGASDNVKPDVENVVGSPFADTIKGSALANLLNGGGGADDLRGLAGADRLLANDGTADAVINCGNGGGDRADIDRVIDPRPSACEQVVKH